MTATLPQRTSASRLRPSDVLRVGASGPRARKTRTALSALGVSIGIAAMVGVLGLSESSKSALLDEISALGTNLLTVESGVGIGGGDGKFPEGSLAAVKLLHAQVVRQQFLQKQAHQSWLDLFLLQRRLQSAQR